MWLRTSWARRMGTVKQDPSRLLFKRLLALTFATGIDVAHGDERYCGHENDQSNEEVVA